MLQEDKKNIEDFKSRVIQNINERVIEDGCIDPHMIFLIREGDDYKNALFMIPNGFFQSSDTKDILAEKVIPSIISNLNSDGKELLIFAIAMEGWMWASEKVENEKIDIEKIKKTQQKIEILTLSFETMESTDNYLYEKRGTKKNKDGEYIEGVYLHPHPNSPMKSTGRFSGLFKAALKVEDEQQA